MKKILLPVLTIALASSAFAQQESTNSCNQPNNNNSGYAYEFNGTEGDNCLANGGAPKYDLSTDAADYYAYSIANGKLTIVKDASKVPTADGWRGFRIGLYDGGCLDKATLDLTTATTVDVKINSTVAVPQFWIAFHNEGEDKWTDNAPDFKTLAVGDNTISFNISGADFWKTYNGGTPLAVSPNGITNFQLYFRTAWNDNNPSGTFVIDYIRIGNTSSNVCSNSVNELSSVSNFSVFPSPATSEVNLKFTAQEATTVTLTDITGRVMISEQVAAGSVSKTYNVSNFAQGLYFVTISGANGQTTEKFMVK